MASTNKTPQGFNLWVESDKPKMEDFNHDNQLLDSELRQKANMSDIIQLHSQKADKDYVEGGLALKPSRTEVYSREEADSQFVTRSELPNLDVTAINEALSNKVNVGGLEAVPLPLSPTCENYGSYPSFYAISKAYDQVHISLHCNKVDGSKFKKDDVIATLPVELRPINMMFTLLLGDTLPQTGSRSVVGLTISTTGNLLISNVNSDATTNANRVTGTFSFPLIKSDL